MVSFLTSPPLVTNTKPTHDRPNELKAWHFAQAIIQLNMLPEDIKNLLQAAAEIAVVADNAIKQERSLSENCMEPPLSRIPARTDKVDPCLARAWGSSSSQPSFGKKKQSAGFDRWVSCPHLQLRQSEPPARWFQGSAGHSTPRDVSHRTRKESCPLTSPPRKPVRQTAQDQEGIDWIDLAVEFCPWGENNE